MTPEQVIKIVCEVMGLDVDLFKGVEGKRPSQAGIYPFGRHISVYLIRKEHDKFYSYESIAHTLGNKRKDGKGDRSATLYNEWIAKVLIKNKDKEFCGWLIKVETEILKQNVNSIPDKNFSRRKNTSK